ncbi:MAG: cell division ATP-binding protein FtsE [Candidatus Limnocylindrales bacterium]
MTARVDAATAVSPPRGLDPTLPAATQRPRASITPSSVPPPATPPRVSIALHDVSKVYPNGRTALADVDLVVPEGDFVFLVGPSGAGKSTMIKLLVRDELATSGEVYIAGFELGNLGSRDIPKLRRQIGIVFQDFKLLPRKTVRENVAFALEVTGTPRRRIAATVEQALALVGLTDQAEQRPNQLSGGEQQRTAIARAMVHDPRVIIADEPTGNLDPLISWEIIQLLLRINDMGTTVLMATHNAEVVTALRKRVVALEDGRLVRDEVGGYHRDY